MTKGTEGARCAWCHRPLAQPAGRGRPRQFCSASHRQRAFEARRRAATFAIPDGQSIVADTDLRQLHDRLYRLEAAVDDVLADLGASTDDPDYRAAYDHLMDAAVDLVGVVIEPVRN